MTNDPWKGSGSSVLVAYRLLRLNRQAWRRLLGGISAPAFRLHGYRDASERAWQSAVQQADCALECGRELSS